MKPRLIILCFLAAYACKKSEPLVQRPPSFLWIADEWTKHVRNLGANNFYPMGARVLPDTFGDCLQLLSDQLKDTSLADFIVVPNIGHTFTGLLVNEYPFTIWLGVWAWHIQNKPYVWIGNDWITPIWNKHVYDRKDVEKKVAIDSSHLFIARVWRDTSIKNADEFVSKPYNIYNKAYIESINEKGHIFDISHYRQFYWLDRILSAPNHKNWNLDSVDVLVRTLHSLQNSVIGQAYNYQKPRATKETKLYFSTYERAYKSDFLELYPKGTLLLPKLAPDKTIDSFQIVNEYIKNYKPTLLYFKNVASESLIYQWYHYALAIHLRSEGDIYKIEKVVLILPKKVFLYQQTNPLGYSGELEINFIN
jgi:hypothetical protein